MTLRKEVNMYNKKYILGLDIGISSVGWGLLLLDEHDNPCKIIDVGSRIFPPGETDKTGESRAKERREKRGTRRVTRRREFRVDRVRNLLYETGYLTTNIHSNLVSEKNEELTKEFNHMIEKYYLKHSTNPYQLKVEALDRPITNEELCIVLVHYAKKRGYKSNREENSDSESGKVKSAIKENEILMKEKNYRTISEMYVKDEKFAKKIKNSAGDYKISVTREMYLDEINKVLDTQIKFGVISESFKKEYVDIWQSQRHYSKGPGGNSKYGGNLIERMTGKCQYDNEPRAPKFAPSSEIFVALTKLVNLRYKTEENKDYMGLSNLEIQTLLNKAFDKKTVTYQDVINILNKKEVKFKDLQLTKKEYGKVIEELKKLWNIPKEQKIEINLLKDSEKETYNEHFQKKLFFKSLFELKGYHELISKMTKSFGKETASKEKKNIEMLDELALFCTNYKLNDEIKEEMEKSENIDKLFLEEDFIESLPNFKDHIMLSTSLVKKLIPLMLEGKRYDEAMNELGYNLNATENQEKYDLLLPINKDNNITNQRVIRSLTQARKVINAVIKKYGLPKMINIETARELAKSRQERNEIKKDQEAKKAKNEEIKRLLVDQGFFTNIEKISSVDLLKYKLWVEQKECCAYSMKKIKIEDLFQNNVVQIDHILPYSRTFNDNYLNKTLVLTKENQDKRNKTPFEWFGNTEKWNKYETFINSLNINPKKKDNYLLRKLDDELAREMRDQNLNDTKYISTELSSFIKAYLNVEKVNLYPGALTSKLRARWGFNRLTHSYISPTYYLPENFKQEIEKDRENHLHHAMDALVIASITPSLEQKITRYEKFSRYIDGLTEKRIHDGELEKIDDNYVDHITGDVISLEDYKKEQMANENIQFTKHNVAKLKFPQPYKNFDEEAKIRVYEQDIENLKFKLKSFSYTKKELDHIHTLTPSIAKSKISGAMHQETYYGIKDIGDITYKTSRKPLEKITKKDLEKIPDSKSGSKDIINAIRNWLGNCEDGASALKANNNHYPINPNDKEKKEIRKIKIYEPYKNTGHMIQNSNVDKGGVYQIDVFKSKNKEDEKLYFAAYDILEIQKIKKHNKVKDNAFKIKLEYAQGSNNFILPYQKVLEDYELISMLGKNDLIKITLKDGRESIAYVVGFSTGKLEVKSKLGDGYDLIGENNVFQNLITRYTITVSTIKKIEKLSISILGEINGL